ncbi:hypothetical protein ACQP3J_32215, partial [Escherichia coli]
VLLLEISTQVFGSLNTEIDDNLISDRSTNELQSIFLPNSYFNFQYFSFYESVSVFFIDVVKVLTFLKDFTLYFALFM